VFEARRSSWLDEPPRALKVFDPIVSRAARHALLEEFRTLTAIRHPHLLAGIDAFDLDEPPFAGCVVFVLELAEEDLAHRVAHAGRLPSGLVASVGADVATGLAALHEQGRIHGDVKPENILRVDDRWLVGDFGVTSVLQGSYAFLPGTTIDFRPPEMAQAADGTRLHRSADIWALGVALYIAVTGRHPFPGPDPMMRYAAVVRGDRLPLPPDVDGRLAWLIETGCLAPDPHHRHDAPTLLTHLRAIAPAPPNAPLASSAPATDGPPPAPSPGSTRPGSSGPATVEGPPPAPSPGASPGSSGATADRAGVAGLAASTGSGPPPYAGDASPPGAPGSPVNALPGGPAGVSGTISAGQPQFGVAGRPTSSGGLAAPVQGPAPAGPWVVGAAVVAVAVTQLMALLAGALTSSLGARRAVYVAGSLVVLAVVAVVARTSWRPTSRQLVSALAAGLAVWALATAQLVLGVVG
jgi:eukaryotic-like serine/threonine-protein kinase